MNPDQPIRVLSVDDHPLLSEGIATLINNQPDMRLVASASTGKEGILKYREHKPDVTLMDLRLPDFSGLEATRLIKARPGAPLVVLMTFHDSAAIRAEAGAAGADRCLSKHEITKELPGLTEALLHTREGGCS